MSNTNSESQLGSDMSRLANYNRKDPNEEFFKMTLLSFKINSKISSKVFEVIDDFYEVFFVFYFLQ